MITRLSQDRLIAFYEVVRSASFSKAAVTLGLTQSALSHRIKNLENELELTLFVRENSGPRLTDAGHKLLQYCRTQFQIEDEFLADLKSTDQDRISGALRIGAVSSLAWSVVVPVLAPFVRLNSGIHLEIMAREVSDLPLLLKRGTVDFIITVAKLNDPSLEEHRVGSELYVLAESSAKGSRNNVYLDHDESDTFTMDFLRLGNGKRKSFERAYLDDIHGLLAGVQAGLGRALIPQHLLNDQAGIRVVQDSKIFRKEIKLYFVRQPFYSKLHEEFVKTMLENASKFL